MIFDKRKGSLLNVIQIPLNVVTPYGTYLGVTYAQNDPEYILSHIRVKTYNLEDLVFSDLSKRYIQTKETPLLSSEGDKIGYGYQITDIETRYGFITAQSKRVSLDTGNITKQEASFILEKQLRNIGNVLEEFIVQPLGQPQYDSLLVYFYYEGVDTIKDHPIIELINNEAWFDITDEIQTGIKKANGRVDETLAVRYIDVSRMWSYVPGFS